MNLRDLKGKKILIVGYGIEGKATEKFLKHFFPNLTYGITDSRDGDSYLKEQFDYDIAIKSPGVQKNQIKIPYTTATNIFFANKNPLHHVIGITGTKGKSTTSSLIYHILKHNGFHTKLIGNIGVPMLNELINEPAVGTFYVVELSSYQLEDINFSPHISVYVSLFTDHLDHHGSLKNYHHAKKRMIEFATPADYVVYNQNFKEFNKWVKNTSATTVPFDLSKVISKVPLIGEHNRENICGAITTTAILGIEKDKAIKSLQFFKSLPHRIEKVGTFKELTFYDDAISTTPESTIAAIDTLENIGTIFLGGLNRGYDFYGLANAIMSKKIDKVVLFPDSGKKIKSALLQQGFNKDCLYETQSMEDAVKYAYGHTPKNKICLLSCASPSYSLWKNFEQKGDEFKHYVVKYGQIKD
jgi:UDP-N-acetylmuramoylalanine--D-glutamate ligase